MDSLIPFACRIGSFVWKASWGPSYHNSMIIATVALVVASLLAFGTYRTSAKSSNVISCLMSVIRQMLIAENKRLDREDKRTMTAAKRQRIEDAARLEGLTFEEALERNKGFRYLY